MMKMNRFASVALVATMVFSLVACGDSASTSTSSSAPSGDSSSSSGDYEYPVVTWKIAHACQDGSPSDLGCVAFADYIMEQSGGNITVEVYPAGQLGTDIQELESCQLGDLEFTSGSSFALQQVSGINGCLMWDLPYFFSPFSVLENEKIALMKDDPSFQTIFVDQLLEKNIHYINQSAHGNYVIFGNKPFKSVDDFAGVKLRAAENAMLVETLEEWGAQPVVINMFELFTALEQGTCDAAYARYLTLEGVPTLLSETIQSMTDSPLVYMLLTVLLLLIIGTFMDVGAAMMVMAPIMHPIAMAYNINPLQYGVVMTMALIIGLTTPPVGSSLYVMASMTGLPFLNIAKKMLPFTFCYVVAMILCIFFEPLCTILVGG